MAGRTMDALSVIRERERAVAVALMRMALALLDRSGDASFGAARLQHAIDMVRTDQTGPDVGRSR